MASIEENRDHWRDYDWSRGGEEWSDSWGGSEVQWQGAILPRIAPFLPCASGLEIACGHGRWSQHLRPFCRELILVDLVEDAVAACRKRFAGDRRVRCFQNDGRSLPMAAAQSLDFVFSFDSLVHCELAELEGYLAEVARALTANGAGFLHHSNFAAVLAAKPGSYNHFWRAESVSAEAVAEACRRLGLVCISQELVNWGGIPACDCFSVVTRPGSVWERELVRVENPHFMAEASSLQLRARVQPVPRGAEKAARRFSARLRRFGRGLFFAFGAGRIE